MICCCDLLYHVRQGLEGELLSSQISKLMSPSRGRIATYIHSACGPLSPKLFILRFRQRGSACGGVTLLNDSVSSLASQKFQVPGLKAASLTSSRRDLPRGSYRVVLSIRVRESLIPSEPELPPSSGVWPPWWRRPPAPRSSPSASSPPGTTPRSPSCPPPRSAAGGPAPPLPAARRSCLQNKQICGHVFIATGEVNH